MVIGAAAPVTTDELARLLGEHMAASQGWQNTLQHAAILWGPGFVILLGLFLLLMRPPKFLGDFIAAQQAQAVSMAKMAEAVDRATARDDRHQEEILVGIQLMLTRMEALERRIADGSR
jgi:hypothetical protein